MFLHHGEKAIIKKIGRETQRIYQGIALKKEDETDKPVTLVTGVTHTSNSDISEGNNKNLEYIEPVTSVTTVTFTPISRPVKCELCSQFNISGNYQATGIIPNNPDQPVPICGSCKADIESKTEKEPSL